MTINAERTLDDPFIAAERALDRLPLEAVAIETGGRTLTVQAVRDQDRLLAASVDLPVFPFGLLLWESAVVLADVLAEGALGHSHAPDGIAGRTVLELGAGTGLAGLAAAALGALVVQTDHSPEALALCRRNAQANALTGIQQQLGDWRDWRSTATFDIVVGADILYEPALHRDIAKVLDAAVTPDGYAILTDPERAHTAGFFTILERAGWRVTQSSRRVPALPPSQPTDTVRVDILKVARA